MIIVILVIITGAKAKFVKIYTSQFCVYTFVFILRAESSKYYARIQTAVTRGLGLPAGRLAGHHSDTASKHSLCYFR